MKTLLGLILSLTIPLIALAQDAATPKYATVLYLTGGPVKVFGLKPAQYINDQALLLGKALGYSITADLPWWSDWGSICDSLAANPKHGKILIFGHSWGGDAAMALTRCLGKKNIQVDLLVTVDSIPILPIVGHTQIPANVVYNFNFFENRDLLLRGFSKNEAAEGSSTIINNIKVITGSISPHLVIPDQIQSTMRLILEKTLTGELSQISIPSELKGQDIEGDDYPKLNFIRNY